MSNVNGLFDLTAFESKQDEDILDMNINEESEFTSKDPASHPEVDVDTDATSAKETNIPVPGGDKETPSAKPEGGEKEIPVPGGDKEAPSAHAVDGATVTTPAKVILSQDTYNDALSSLKKSFKEGYEIMELLERATVQTKSTEDLQREFTENAIAEAQYESMISGPMFEAVDRSDKKLIKGIIKNIRDKVADFADKDKVVFYKPAVFLRTFFHRRDDDISMSTIYLWQVLGGIILEEGNIQDYVKRLTEEFAEELGDYKILAVRVHPTNKDKDRNKGKNLRKVFFLLIDKKLNSEIKNAIAKLETKSDENDDKNCKDKSKCKNKKNEVVTESVYDYDYEDDEE